MPRPVEALPCGSRSTIRTSSPIAASAVPRLIAVVVLPTPPFWLATARTRGGLAVPRSGKAKGTILACSGTSVIAAYPNCVDNYKLGNCNREMYLGTPRDHDLGLGIRSTRHQTHLNLPTFSGFGQFAATSCPLGNRPVAPFFNSGDASPSSFLSGAKARAVTTSMLVGACLTKSAIRSAWTMAGAPQTCAASRRKAAFLPMLSTRWTWTPGLSASAQAMTKPGKPPPDPRSTQI